MTKEVLTIQFGRAANFVGSHFWNVQEEAYGLEQWHSQENSSIDNVDHAVLQRFTEHQGYEQCTPRAVIVDATGSLGGHLGKAAASQDSAPSVPTWGGAVSVHRSPAVPTTAFVENLREIDEDQQHAQASGYDTTQSQQQIQEALEKLSTSARVLQEPDAVKYWTDYLTVRLHPSTVWQLPGIFQGASDFQGYGLGRVQGSSSETQEEVAERVRLFAEECDSLQGFQLMVDDLTGFGSIATDAVIRLQEDFPKSKQLAMPIRLMPEPQGKDRRLHILSQCLSLAELSPAVSLYAPLTAPQSLPRASYPWSSLWHTSAVCAAFLDSATLPMRLSPQNAGSCDLHSLSSLLAVNGNIVCSAGSLPCPPAGDDSISAESKLPFTLQECSSWSPGLVYSGWAQEVEAECLVLRGPHRHFVPLLADAATAALNAALISEDQRAVRHCCIASKGMRLPLPFPHLFHPRRLPGRRDGGAVSQGSAEAASVPILTRMANSNAIQPFIEHSTDQFEKVAATAVGKGILEGWGYDSSEIQETIQGLYSLQRGSDASSDLS